MSPAHNTDGSSAAFIVDLKNTKTEKLRWCRIVWRDFENPTVIACYATSMLTNWDLPARNLLPDFMPDVSAALSAAKGVS